MKTLVSIILISGLFISATIKVDAQYNNIMLLNEYKSIVLKPKKPNAEYNDVAEEVITKVLLESGFPRPADKSILYTEKGSSCELLTCNYLVKNASNISVEIRTNIEFINCDYETVFEIDETTKSSFYSKRAVKKSLEEAMMVFKNFEYSYQPPQKETIAQTKEKKQETAQQTDSKAGGTYKFLKQSDVDKNIPASEKKYPNRFALIIGNEDYSSQQMDLSSEVNVAYARNDASAFKAYAMKLLGIPEENIIFLLDATTGQMHQAIAKLNLIIKNTRGNADVYVYYAGHGLPEEETKKPYLMPVDVSGKNPQLGISLQNFYNTLSKHPSKKVTVFIDACFSGGARNQGLVAARGVKIKPKDNMLKGNIVSFTASSGNQSSLPLDDEKHGFFTYYLLKKLKSSGGEITYGELSDYLTRTISLKSVLLNDKEQTPQTNVSMGITEKWKTWELNPKD